MKIQKSKKSTRRILTLVVIVVFVVSIPLAVWYFSSRPKGSETTSRPVNTVDYSSPTQEDLESSQDAKKRGEKNNQEDAQDTPDTPNKTAKIGISFANVEGDNFEVRAFVTNIIEGTGICSVSLTSGGVAVTKKSPAFIDASSSQCEPILIPLSELNSSRSWSLVVSYSSPTASGTTSPEIVNL